MAQLRQELEEAMEGIRQSIKGHGGDVELVDMDYGKQLVTVRLHGACVGCPMSAITLKHGVEAELNRKFPWVKHVEAVE